MYGGVQAVTAACPGFCLPQHALSKQSMNRVSLEAECPLCQITARVCARMQIESWGYHTIPVSAASGQGLAQLNEALKGKVSVVAGPSGASLSLPRAVYAGRVLRASAEQADARNNLPVELCQVQSHPSSGDA